MASNQAEALAALEKANQDRLKKEFGGKAGTKFVTEVRESMLFQYNWADLLSAAPTALSLLGACHVASSSPEAAAISLGSAMPKDGWQHLKVAEKPTLKACLVFVGDCGAKAFSIAASNMDSIAGTAGDLTEIVTEVIRATQKLPDPGYARILDNKLIQLRRLSDSCLNYADDTEKAFDTWLLCVAEFHVASVQKHGTTEAEAEANASLKLQAEIESSYKTKEIETADKAATAMLKSLEKAEAAFQKANDDIPTAWESCAMGAINAIAQAGPSIVAQTLPALLNGLNPMSAVNSLAGAIGKAATNGASNAPGASPLAGALIGAVAGQAAANGAASNSVLAPAEMAPPTDPAYTAAPLIAPFLNNLYSYITQGPGNGVDWTKFKDMKKDEDGKLKSADGVTWLLTNVKQQEKTAQLGTGQPSEDLKGAFTKMIKTIEAIKAEVGKSSDMASSGTDPATVKTWQEDIKQAKATVLQLETTAKSFPGTSTNTPQLRSLKIDVPKTDHTAQTAALSTATEKLAINQQALETSQQNYQKAAESALKVQQELTAIQTKLKGLEVEGQTLEKVKEILIDCIATLVQLKVQINKLKNFFGALSTMVRVVVQNKVKKFDEDVSSVATDSKKKQMLRLTDMDIEIIYSSTLQIKAYFELLQTIARMYSKMHVDHVSKGIEKVWDLSQVLKDPNQVRTKRDALNAWADDASKAILKTVADKQNEIKDGLEQRIENIAEQTQMLEKVGVATPDPAFVAAMRTGAATVTEHVEKNMPQSLAVQVNDDVSC